MNLPNGKYHTKAGSRVEIFGKYSGSWRASFDWVEEENACFDCEVSDVYDGYLTWSCDVCGGGSAELLPDKESEG